jgi:hypothetical protein
MEGPCRGKTCTSWFDAKSDKKCRKKKLAISNSIPTIGTSLGVMVEMVIYAMLLQGLVTIQLALPPVTDVAVAL